MDTLTDKLGDILAQLGRAFLIASYLPSALFVLAHQLFFFPRWLDHSITLLQTDSLSSASTNSDWIYLIDKGITMLLLPLLIGILLISLNTTVIKLYEGAYSWQRQFLLRPWQRRNQRRAKELYGNLVTFKKAYTQILADLTYLPAEANRLQLEQDRGSIELKLQEEHDKIETQSPVQRLPRRTSIVKPTSLGNAFAVTEEYSYERYGMDGMLFWPRLRPLLGESHVTTLINTKMALDLLLNFSLLALAFGLEAILVGVWSTADWSLIGAGFGMWILAYVCYKGAVSTVYSLGDTIALCFDLYRSELWEQFGFPPPKTLNEEQTTWLQLGQFLRRGEAFYFPEKKPEGPRANEKRSKSTFFFKLAVPALVVWAACQRLKSLLRTCITRQ